MPQQDTAGPEGAAKAVADSKKLMEGWKSGPMGTKSGHLEDPKPQVHPDASKASYQLASDARKASGDHAPTTGPAGNTSGQELHQAEENAHQLNEALKPQQ